MPIYISNFIYTFYMNEYINLVLMKDQNKWLKSHQKFVADFNIIRELIAKKMSEILYDYTIYASIDELTTAFRNCDIAPVHLLGHKIYEIFDEDSLILENIDRLHIPSYINMCEIVFLKEGHWGTCFGGEKWWKPLKYCRDLINNPYQLVDSLVDLQHNTGSFLNKSNPYICVFSSLQNFLNMKNRIEDENDLLGCFLRAICNNQPYILRKLYIRFINLYKPEFKCFIHDFLSFKCGTEEEWEKFICYKPIEYTGELREYEIVFSYDIEEEYDKYCELYD